jgi:hypothetical protein
MEFLDVPLIDDDIAKLLVRFAIDLVFLTLIVRVVYFRHSGTKDFLFSFYMINILVFFIVFSLKKYELNLGMALGLFAIFGILRYRTDTIPIKEMTYLFMVIGVAIINALAGTQLSYLELAFTNVSIVGFAGILENLPLLRREIRETVLYEKIDYIKPENHARLVADLEDRTGLKISRVELGQIDFLRDTVTIDIFYYPSEQASSAAGDVKVTLRSQ